MKAVSIRLLNCANLVQLVIMYVNKKYFLVKALPLKFNT